jgi:hypothetical protein
MFGTRFPSRPAYREVRTGHDQVGDAGLDSPLQYRFPIRIELRMQQVDADVDHGTDASLTLSIGADSPNSWP